MRRGRRAAVVEELEAAVILAVEIRAAVIPEAVVATRAEVADIQEVEASAFPVEVSDFRAAGGRRAEGRIADIREAMAAITRAGIILAAVIPGAVIRAMGGAVIK